MQTVHTPYGIRELEHLITHGGGKAAIALARTKDRSPAGDIASLRERIPALRLVIAVGGDVPGAVNFSTLLKQGRGKSPPPRPDANDPFLLLYTSGTTSSPKAVSVSANHFLSNARMCAVEFGLKPDRPHFVPRALHASVWALCPGTWLCRWRDRMLARSLHPGSIR